MTRAQKIILTIGVLVALSFTGVGVYAATAETTVTPGPCLYRDRSGLPRRSTSPGVCVYGPTSVDKPPLDGTAPLWFFGAGAAAVLTGLGLALTRPTVPRTS